MKIDPEHPLAWGKIGEVYAGEHRYDRARPALEKAVKLAPDNTWAHLNLGVLLREEGEYDAAIAQFNAILKYSPDNAPAQNELEQTEGMK